MTDHARQAADSFIELMGRHFDEEGIPRIAGRLFGLLMLTEEACSLDDLAERLRVSKGSVSSNARLLENLGIIERVTRPGDRRDYYQMAGDMSARLLERQIERVKLFLERIRGSRQRLEPLPGPVDARFDEAVSFNELALRAFAGMLDEVRSPSRGS